jgi:hypothetical protein
MELLTIVFVVFIFSFMLLILHNIREARKNLNSHLKSIRRIRKNIKLSEDRADEITKTTTYDSHSESGSGWDDQEVK